MGFFLRRFPRDYPALVLASSTTPNPNVLAAAAGVDITTLSTSVYGWSNTGSEEKWRFIVTVE